MHLNFNTSRRTIRIRIFFILQFILFAAFRPCVADDSRQITFSKEVSRIFQKRCQECHRPGEVAPMPLLNYEDARPWAKSIKKEVLARTMPPWHADSKFGKFTNDISLTEEEIGAIARWVDAGAPEGDRAELSPPLKFDDSGWKLGKPDLILYPKEAFVVHATQKDKDLYQCLVMPTNLEQDTWVQGIEYKPDNRKVVHHIIAFADQEGKALARDAQTPEPGFPCGMGTSNGGMSNVVSVDSMLGGWAPGTPPMQYGEGLGKPLKKGCYVILQMHYFNQTENNQSDRSGLGFYFAKGPVHRQARAMPIVSPMNQFLIKAGDANSEHFGKWMIPRDVIIHTLAPHMHYLGRDMAFIANYPDGTSETLISVPRYSFNWQKAYVLAEPKRLSKGATLQTISHHDNSANNPNNPSKPPVDVKWGESTTEEMAIGWVGYSFADEDLAAKGDGRRAKDEK